MEQQLQNLSVGKAFVIGIAIMAGYYFMMYDSGESREQVLATAEQGISQKQVQVQQMQETLEAAARYQAIAAQLGEEMIALTKAAPENYTTTDLRKLLSDEARAAGTNILRVDPQTAQNNDQGAAFIPLTVQIEIEGTFNQLMFFLSNLTKVGKIIVTKEIELATKEPERVLDVASPILSMRAVFEAYRYDPNAGKGEGVAQ